MNTTAVVGRDDGLAAIAAFLALQDEGRALVLDGAAGIGKTTLWLAGVERARAQGMKTLVARPAAAEATLPFAGLADLLEPVLADVARRLTPVERRSLEVALLLREPEGPEDQRRIARAALSALRTLAEDRPVLLAIDDVQWLDLPTARALSFAVRRLGDAPVALLAAQRVGLDAALELPDAKRLAVEGLDASSLGEIAAARLGIRLERRTLLRLARLTDGNPLYALEIARALHATGTDLAPGTPTPLPPELDGLLRARVSGAPQDVRELLLLAAAAGSPSFDLLDRLGVSGETIARADALELAFANRDRLRFAHPLIGSVVYDSVTDRTRRSTHSRLAATVEEPDQRALHLALATVVADESISATLIESAGRLLQRGAPDTAAALAGHALRLTPAHASRDVHERTLFAAHAHATVGADRHAASLLEAHIARLPRGDERSEAVLRLLTHTHRDLATATERCEEALAEARDSGIRARLVLLLANLVGSRGDMRRSFTLVEEAVALAERADDIDTLSTALTRVGMLQWQRGNGIRADLFERAGSLSPTEALGRFDWHPIFTLACLCGRAGDVERARRLLRSTHDEAVRSGDERLRSLALPEMAMVECRAGDAGSAWRFAREGLQLARELHGDEDDGKGPYWASFVAARLGRVDDARTLAAHALERAHATDFELLRLCVHDVLGDLALSLGDLAETVEELAPIAASLEPMGWGEPSVVDAHHNLAEALVGLGRIDEAAKVVAELQAYAERPQRIRSLAQAARGRGLVAAARQDVDGAIASFEEAVALQDTLPEPYERARTLFVHGSLLRRLHRKAAARELLEEAARTFDACGSHIWASNARSELARIGGRAARPGELTETEQRIAELVARGRSNHEVAHALHVSPKTVEWNLSKVYRKLRVSSRTELAAKLTRAS